MAALIDKMNKRQDAQKATKDGDVTEHGILLSLDNAMRESNLVKFETFLGENWSSAAATRSVYAQMIETPELPAANRGATLFMERLYQTLSDLVSDEMRDKAERLLEQASVSGVKTIEPRRRREASDYALR